MSYYYFLIYDFFNISGANRDQFKQFVNTLASVKVDEVSNNSSVLKNRLCHIGRIRLWTCM